jgi:hypothetical protein
VGVVALLERRSVGTEVPPAVAVRLGRVFETLVQWSDVPPVPSARRSDPCHVDDPPPTSRVRRRRRRTIPWSPTQLRSPARAGRKRPHRAVHRERSSSAIAPATTTLPCQSHRIVPRRVMTANYESDSRRCLARSRSRSRPSAARPIERFSGCQTPKDIKHTLLAPRCLSGRARRIPRPTP